MGTWTCIEGCILNKKSICIILFVLILINVIIGYYMINQPNKKNSEAKSFDNNIVIAIYPSGTTSETYYFDISKTGKVTETFGTRKTNDISSINFMYCSAYSLFSMSNLQFIIG